MANPYERQGKNTAIRAGELILDAKTAVARGGGFFYKSWSEAAKDVGAV